MEALAISPDEIAQAAARAIAEIERRRELWLHGRRPISLAGRTAIVVDDGVATGHGRSAAQVVRRSRLSKVEPYFLSVGAYYADFHQLDDGEMTASLTPAALPTALAAQHQARR